MPLLGLDPQDHIDRGQNVINRLRWPVVSTQALCILYASMIDASSHRVPLEIKSLCMSFLYQEANASLEWLTNHNTSTPVLNFDGLAFRILSNGLVEGWADFISRMGHTIQRVWLARMENADEFGLFFGSSIPAPPRPSASESPFKFRGGGFG